LLVEILLPSYIIKLYLINITFAFFALSNFLVESTFGQRFIKAAQTRDRRISKHQYYIATVLIIIQWIRTSLQTWKRSYSLFCCSLCIAQGSRSHVTLTPTGTIADTLQQLPPSTTTLSKKMFAHQQLPSEQPHIYNPASWCQRCFPTTKVYLHLEVVM
jgi:hypothetical protein